MCALASDGETERFTDIPPIHRTADPEGTTGRSTRATAVDPAAPRRPGDGQPGYALNRMDHG